MHLEEHINFVTEDHLNLLHGLGHGCGLLRLLVGSASSLDSCLELLDVRFVDTYILHDCCSVQ
jgi:hypothetical protein